MFGSGITAILVIGFAVYLLLQEDLLRGQVHRLAEQQQLQGQLHEMRGRLALIQRDLLRLKHAQDPGSLTTSLGVQIASLEEQLRAMKLSLPASPRDDGDRELLEFIGKARQSYSRFSPALDALPDQHKNRLPQDAQHVAQLQQVSEQLTTLLNRFIAQRSTEHALRLQTFNHGVDSLRLQIAGIAAFAVFAMAVFLFLMHRHLIRPLQRLDAFVGGINEPAEVSERANIIYQDEIGSVANALNRMLDRLQESVVSRNHFDHVLSNLSNALLVTDSTGKLETVNASACELFGCEKSGLLGRSMSDILPEAACEYLSQQQVFHDLETELQTPAGTVVPVLMSAERLPQEEGGWVIVASNISERRKTEDRLRHSEERYRQVIENVSEGILVVQDAKIVFVNPAVLSITDYAMDEIVGADFLPLVFPDDRAKVLDRYTRRIRGEPIEHKYDFRIRRKAGEPVWVELSAVLIQWEGSPATLSFISNITERKQAEQDILAVLEKQKELSDLKSRFVSMTSHEFRTPLATILSSDELLRDYGDRLSVEERGELLASIETAVKRMTQLLDDVLVIGKAEAGRLDFHPEAIALRTFCENLLEEISTANEREDRPQHDVDFHFDENCDPALLDEKLLRHILGNLLSNAAKYSPEGGRVGLSVSCAGNSLEFVITDQGIGIPEDAQPRLFETFFRAKNVGGISGTGLGLAIVKRAVDVHGGTIEYESQQGQGTRFIVRLPRTEVRHG